MKGKKTFSTRPRLTVFRSHRAIYAQLIDDQKGQTLVAASSLNQKQGSKADQAFAVGEKLAEKALAKKIKKVFFDRGVYRYHGRIKALAEGARKGGLLF